MKMVVEVINSRKGNFYTYKWIFIVFSTTNEKKIVLEMYY